MPLSDSWLKANNNKDHPAAFEQADRDGLSVRVSQKGKIKFQIRFRYGGKQQRCDIGTYPLMGLADARKEAQRYRAELDQGKDPRVLRKVERKAILYAGTFEEMFRQWFATKADMVSAPEILRTFELHVFPSYGPLPAKVISLHVWLDLLERHAKTRPHIAQRILTNIRLMYRWAVKRQLVEHNPVADIVGASDLNIKPNTDHRCLSDEEIALFYKALSNSQIWPKNRLLMELCLFYGCRVSELRLAERGHFDFKAMVWTVPAENHKMGHVMKRPIRRPIIPEIVPLIKQLMETSTGRFLFPHRNEDRPVSNRAHIKIPGQLITILQNQGHQMASWSTHDLRKTARTNWSSLTSLNVAEVMLGHKLPGVQGVYDHYDYLPEQAAAYKAWWDRLQQINKPE